MSGAFGLPTGPRNDHLRHMTDNKPALHVGENTFVVTLYDNPAAHDLLARLPLTLQANVSTTLLIDFLVLVFRS